MPVRVRQVREVAAVRRVEAPVVEEDVVLAVSAQGWFEAAVLLGRKVFS